MEGPGEAVKPSKKVAREGLLSGGRLLEYQCGFNSPLPSGALADDEDPISIACVLWI